MQHHNRNIDPIAYAQIVGFVVVYIYDWDEQGVYASMSPIDRHPKYLPFDPKENGKVFHVGKCPISFSDINDFDKNSTVITHLPIEYHYTENGTVGVGKDDYIAAWTATDSLDEEFGIPETDQYMSDWEKTHPHNCGTASIP